MTSRFFTTTTQALLGPVLLFCIVGCSPGFQGNQGAANLSGASSLPSSGSSSGSGTSTGTPAQNWANVSMDATVSGGSANNSLAITLDKPNKMLVVHLPIVLGLSGIMIGNTLSISQLPGTTLGFETVGTSTALTLRIPLTYVMHGASFLPNGQLPNGSSLSTVGIPDGELPNLGISLNNAGNMKVSIFLDPSVVGLYMSSPIDPLLAISVPIRLANKEIVGYFSTVPAKAPYDGGFFLSVKVPTDIADAIDDVI